jgi:pyruvate formate lyase activating enzyme
MGTCALCEERSEHISKEMNVCLKCIRERPQEALQVALKGHARSRAAFKLPESPPQDPQGASCNICVNKCRIAENEIGYCGVRKNEEGKLIGVSPEQGKLSWYHDPLPTNCVGDWICPGGTGAGVFFHACSFNCLYCQNWHFRKESLKPAKTSVESLVSDVDEKTSCICYFGGDPTPQLPFAINASKRALEKNKGRILRICWETNGSMNSVLLEKMIKLSLDSGGCIKFDIKAFDENLHITLTGVSNKRTLENFARVGERTKSRKIPPLLIASTLLVPGYIDEQEIRDIVKFIASVDPEIPYSLLAFYPHFFMSDMLLTQRKIAETCLEIAQEEGLKNVRLGNVHLLS